MCHYGSLSVDPSENQITNMTRSIVHREAASIHVYTTSRRHHHPFYLTIYVITTTKSPRYTTPVEVNALMDRLRSVEIECCQEQSEALLLHQKVVQLLQSYSAVIEAISNTFMEVDARVTLMEKQSQEES